MMTLVRLQCSKWSFTSIVPSKSAPKNKKRKNFFVSVRGMLNVVAATTDRWLVRTG